MEKYLEKPLRKFQGKEAKSSNQKINYENSARKGRKDATAKRGTEKIDDTTPPAVDYCGKSDEELPEKLKDRTEKGTMYTALPESSKEPNVKRNLQ